MSTITLKNTCIILWNATLVMNAYPFQYSPLHNLYKSITKQIVWEKKELFEITEITWVEARQWEHCSIES